MYQGRTESKVVDLERTWEDLQKILQKNSQKVLQIKCQVAKVSSFIINKTWLRLSRLTTQLNIALTCFYYSQLLFNRANLFLACHNLCQIYRRYS